MTVEMFARRYPDRVAGLVLLDAATSESPMIERASNTSAMQREAVCLGRIAARLGILRLMDPLGFRTLSPDGADRVTARIYRAETMDTACGLMRGIPQSLKELEEAPANGRRPMGTTEGRNPINVSVPFLPPC